MWTFGRKVAAGFTLAFLMLLVIGGVSLRSMRTLTTTGEWVTHTHLVLERLSACASQLKDAETSQRGYVITGDDAYLEPWTRATLEIPKTAKELRDLTIDNGRQTRRLDELDPLLRTKLEELKHVIDLRRTSGFDVAAREVEVGAGKRTMDAIRRVLDEMEREERGLLKVRALEAETATTSAITTIVAGTFFCLVIVFVAGFSITRSVGRQIGSAVEHVHSSSAELQTAALQQVTGSREQATAMTQITTTMNELLVSSRQIAESAQRVAHTATQATSSARSGEETVQRTRESVVAIRRQVDGIVANMIELGRKSQRIGAILDIINELSEQTNILAINATIEAAGAGEAGRRFGVVADEIRKLADRVGPSTKDIRVLVDETRAAIDTTVLATEGGSKAVDAGAHHFGDVAAAFGQISELVAMTTEAVQEIELSTRQQATAVEQVKVAVANASQAARETEVSSGQTLQTSGHLTTLAKDLRKIIQADA